MRSAGCLSNLAGRPGQVVSNGTRQVLQIRPIQWPACRLQRERRPWPQRRLLIDGVNVLGISGCGERWSPNVVAPLT